MGAEHRQGINVQSVHPWNVITCPEKKGALTRAIEVLHLNAGVAGIATPGVPQIRISPSLSESRGKQRLPHRQLYFEADLMARETFAIQEIAPNTTFVRVLR